MISRKMYLEFIYNIQSSILLTRENFCFDVALMITESSAYNFTHLTLGGIFHRIAPGSNHCKSCFFLFPTYFQC